MEPRPRIPVSNLPPEGPEVVVVDVMLRCKLDNEVVPASMALQHQQMHEKKGEQPCFVVETSPLQKKSEREEPSGVM
ncbi:MAG: hypothetical protein K1T65_08110 [Candidatus Aramenus sp.]|nr:hypothetical protein [Candidatus Aramenus sp.]